MEKYHSTSSSNVKLFNTLFKTSTLRIGVWHISCIVENLFQTKKLSWNRKRVCRWLGYGYYNHIFSDVVQSETLHFAREYSHINLNILNISMGTVWYSGIICLGNTSLPWRNPKTTNVGACWEFVAELKKRYVYLRKNRNFLDGSVWVKRSQ